MRAVLFDLDGTLLDSIDGIVSSFRHVLDLYVPGHHFDRQALINTIGEPLQVQMRQFAAGDEALAVTMIAAYRKHNAELLPSFELFSGVKACLDSLRQRAFITGLVTSKLRASADVSLDRHELRPKFDLILTADDTTKHKPDPLPLLLAAQRLNLQPADMAYVGDSVHDLRCAHAAGCMAIAALWGPFEHHDLLKLKPAYALKSLSELLALPLFAGVSRA